MDPSSRPLVLMVERSRLGTFSWAKTMSLPARWDGFTPICVCSTSPKVSTWMPGGARKKWRTVGLLPNTEADGLSMRSRSQELGGETGFAPVKKLQVPPFVEICLYSRDLCDRKFISGFGTMDNQAFDVLSAWTPGTTTGWFGHRFDGL